MCQAYEGERAYIDSRDAWIREKGYNAQKAGISRDACPEYEHPIKYYSDAEQWRIGWDLAAEKRALW